MPKLAPFIGSCPPFLVRRSLSSACGAPNDAPNVCCWVNDDDRRFCYLARASGFATRKPLTHAIHVLSPINAGNRPAKYIDSAASVAYVAGVGPEPRVPEVLLASSTIREWPFRMLRKKSPDVKVLYTAVLMDEMPGGTLAKTKQH